MNPSKFESLVKQHYSELYNFALRITGQPHIAEDIVQETFARAWKARASLKELSSARAWLYTILRRENARLHERQRPEVRPPECLPELIEIGHDCSTEAFNLRRALKTLPMKYKEPLLLQVIGGFSCLEIGDMLAISDSAVMTRVYRARRTLKNTLAPESTKELAQ